MTQLIGFVDPFYECDDWTEAARVVVADPKDFRPVPTDEDECRHIDADRLILAEGVTDPEKLKEITLWVSEALGEDVSVFTETSPGIRYDKTLDELRTMVGGG